MDINPDSLKEKHLTNTLFLVAESFVLCWALFSICDVVWALTEQRAFSIKILDTLLVVSHLKSAIHPLIYAYRVKDVQKSLKLFFSWNDFRDSEATSEDRVNKRKTTSDTEL